MKKLKHSNKIARNIAKYADFLFVYIEEAHPMEGWSFQGNYKIHNHKSLQNRLEAAQMLADTDLAGTLVVDSMTDETCREYGARPERLYIVLNGVVVYVGKKGPEGYNVGEVEEWLEAFAATGA